MAPMLAPSDHVVIAQSRQYAMHFDQLQPRPPTAAAQRADALSHDRADFQHATTGERMGGGDVDRLRHVLALQQIEPQQCALGFQERAVGD